MLAAICWFAQSVSEAKAENRGYPESAAARVGSATVPSPATGDIRLAKSGKSGQGESENENWRRVDENITYRSNAPTRVTVIGNTVLVPVTLVYRGREVDVQLVLDTGASVTMIKTEIADQLNINLSGARKMRVQVAGGAVIIAHLVTLNSITVGPHEKRNALISVLPHRGPAVPYDGLLGMDVLRGVKFNVDFDKQMIIWE
jgi:predicted aspartyl protease